MTAVMPLPTPLQGARMQSPQTRSQQQKEPHPTKKQATLWVAWSSLLLPLIASIYLVTRTHALEKKQKALGVSRGATDKAITEITQNQQEIIEAKDKRKADITKLERQKKTLEEDKEVLSKKISLLRPSIDKQKATRDAKQKTLTEKQAVRASEKKLTQTLTQQKRDAEQKITLLSQKRLEQQKAASLPKEIEVIPEDLLQEIERNKKLLTFCQEKIKKIEAIHREKAPLTIAQIKACYEENKEKFDHATLKKNYPDKVISQKRVAAYLAKNQAWATRTSCSKKSSQANRLLMSASVNVCKKATFFWMISSSSWMRAILLAFSWGESVC